MALCACSSGKSLSSGDEPVGAGEQASLLPSAGEDGGADGVHSSMPDWGYEGPGKPQDWGTLNPDYALCASGEQQSPIDITDYRHDGRSEVSFSYTGKATEMESHGRFAYMIFPPGNEITVDGHSYELKQAHAHAPSEHAIDGETFAAEVHLVHENASGALAVVGLLYKLGPSHPVLDLFAESMPASADTPVDTGLDIGIAAADLLPSDLDYFAYDGSLTTPPCSEGVKWLVMESASTISENQVNQLLAYSGGPTNRPLQPLGTRAVINAVASL